MNEELNKKIDSMRCLVDLHLHLDGAISIDNCKMLAKMQNIEIPKNDDELRKLIMVNQDCNDLNEFLTKFKFPLSLLQTKQAIKKSITNLVNELYSNGLIYAEIRFAPQLHINQGLSQEEVVLSAIEALKNSRIKTNLILCCMRGIDNEKENLETVEIAKKYLNNGVSAIDLAGAEGLYPTSNFKKIFEHARKLDIPFTIHAGEADGPESVKCAIDYGAKRIGHGVRSIEDIKVMNMLKQKNITLEVCPTSNICTSIYKSINKIPIKTFINEGISFTINTDDPVICNITLKNELKLIAKAFNLTYNDIINLQINSINSAFLKTEEKQELIEKILQYK